MSEKWPTLLSCQDEPEVSFATEFLRRATVGNYQCGWTYGEAGGLLHFDWEGVKRVWKNTGKTHVADGKEYTVLRWPD